MFFDDNNHDLANMFFRDLNNYKDICDLGHVFEEVRWRYIERENYKN